MEKLFVLYDGRAVQGPTDDASVYSTASSEKEAIEDGLDLFAGYDGIWYEYDVAKGNGLINKKRREDLPPFSVMKNIRRQ